MFWLWSCPSVRSLRNSSLLTGRLVRGLSSHCGLSGQTDWLLDWLPRPGPARPAASRHHTQLGTGQAGAETVSQSQTETETVTEQNKQNNTPSWDHLAIYSLVITQQTYWYKWTMPALSALSAWGFEFNFMVFTNRISDPGRSAQSLW